MTYLEAKEPWPVPAVNPSVWRRAHGELPPITSNSHVLKLTPMADRDLTSVLRLSFAGVGLIALGFVAALFGVTAGYFAAGVGCVIVAGVGIYIRLSDRAWLKARS